MINIQNQSTLDKVLMAPTNVALEYTLPKISDPEASFAVSVLANVSSRLLFVVQSVLSAVALPFLWIYNVISMHFMEPGDALAATLKTLGHVVLPLGGITAAVAPNSTIRALSQLARVAALFQNLNLGQNARRENGEMPFGDLGALMRMGQQNEEANPLAGLGQLGQLLQQMRPAE